MKRVTSFLLICAILMPFYGCAISGSAFDRVSEFCDALQNYDAQHAAEYLVSGEEGLQDVFLKDSENEKVISLRKDIAGKMTYQIRESNVKGKNATVTVEFTYLDALSILEQSAGEVLLDLSTSQLSDLNESEMTETLLNVFIENCKADEARISFSEWVDITFHCEKMDGMWMISDLSENDKETLGKVLSGNISTLTDVMDKLKLSEEDGYSGPVFDNKENYDPGISDSSEDELKSGEYWCMGMNDTCPRKTYSPYDLYCSKCDPDNDNVEN